MKSIRVCGLFLAALTCAILLLAQSHLRGESTVTSTASIVSVSGR